MLPLGLALLGVALFAVLPLALDKFYVQLATRILIMALFAMSLDLLVGHTGLVSLGHAGFFGVAGYLLALTSPPYEAANLWLSLLIALSGAAALSLGIGFLVLRTSGVYFIMATLAFGQMLYHVFHDTTIAGGSDGMYVYVRPGVTLFGWRPMDLENYMHLYFFVLAIFLAVFVVLRVLLASPFGKSLAGIRVNEHRMRSLGFSAFQVKLAAFVLAGTLAGLAGYLATLQFGVVNPDMLGWQLSGIALVMVILGGMGSALGPLLGAAALLLAELVLQSLTKHWQLPMGILIVLLALLLPRGLAGIAAARKGTVQA
jgi:branched-chain amino acid transport system permease protein